jgi:hypothetical protein
MTESIQLNRLQKFANQLLSATLFANFDTFPLFFAFEQPFYSTDCANAFYFVGDLAGKFRNCLYTFPALLCAFLNRDELYKKPFVHSVEELLTDKLLNNEPIL